MQAQAVLLLCVAFVGAVSAHPAEALLPLLNLLQDSPTPLKSKYYLKGLDQLQLIQCTPCAEGQLEMEECTIAADRVCGNGVGKTTLKTSIGTFPAFVAKDTAGRRWVKAIQWRTDYKFVTDAAGDITTEDVSQFAKLSDDQINSFGATRMYKIESNDKTWQGASSWNDKYLYVISSAKHVDTSNSWGLLPANGATRAKYGNGAFDLSTTSSNSWPTWGNTWWDTLNNPPGLAGNDCTRMFLGYNNELDCWREGNQGKRCLRAGNSCSDHMKHPGVTVWILLDN